MRKALFLCLPALALIPAAAAQSRSPSNFFAEGYAAQPGVQQRTDNDWGQQESPANGREERKITERDSRGSAPQAPAVRTSSQNQPVFPIISIGAVLSTQDQGHVQDELKNLAALALERNLKLGSIITVGRAGPELSQDPNIQFQLWILEGRLSHSATLPDKYGHISHSPTWIISTAHGEVLLETVQDINRYISSDGKYIDEDGTLTAAAKAPISNEITTSTNKRAGGFEEALRRMQQAAQHPDGATQP